MNDAKNATIVSLNVPSVGVAIDLVKKLAPHVGGFSIGPELLFAMLRLLMSPTFISEIPRAEIRKLFFLLGYDVLRSLNFVFEAGRVGCKSIIFTPNKMVLIGEKGKQLKGMTPAGTIVEVGTDLYLSSATKIVQAPDLVAAAQQAVAENELEMIKNARMNGKPDTK